MANYLIQNAKKNLQAAGVSIMEVKSGLASEDIKRSVALYYLRHAADDIVRHVIHETRCFHRMEDLAYDLSLFPAKYKDVLGYMWLAVGLLDKANITGGIYDQEFLYIPQLEMLYAVLDYFIGCVEKLSPDVEYNDTGIASMQL